MNQQAFVQFIEQQINGAAQQIIRDGDKLDDFAGGQLAFYLNLRKVVKKTASRSEMGMLDAVNDTLQALGIIERSQTLVGYIEQDPA